MQVLAGGSEVDGGSAAVTSLVTVIKDRYRKTDREGRRDFRVDSVSMSEGTG